MQYDLTDAGGGSGDGDAGEPSVMDGGARDAFASDASVAEASAPMARDAGRDGGGPDTGPRDGGAACTAATRVLSVAGPLTARNYAAGETLDFTVTFNAAVTVTGTPALQVVVDASRRPAPYVSGSGSATLVFRFTVEPGNIDSDGVALASPLSLPAGAAIRDASMADVCLGFTAPSFPSLRLQSYVACPANYVLVPFNPLYGTAAFCVAKYEMRDAAGVPASEPGGMFWRIADTAEGETLCRSLGAGFRLVTNEDWQTMARDAEGVADNWSGKSPDTGLIALGNVDVEYGAATGDDDDPCTTLGFAATAPDCENQDDVSQFFRRRTHLLSTGGVVWDLGGNISEWVTGSHPELTRGFICEMAGTDKVLVGPAGDFSVACPHEGMPVGVLDTHGLGFSEGAGGIHMFRGASGGLPAVGGSGLFYSNTNPYWDVTHAPQWGFRCAYQPASPGALPLAIFPARVHVGRGLTQRFTARGGTGPLTITLTTNRSGGSFSAATGLYTAGATPGVIDELTVRDATGATAVAWATTQ